MSAALSTIVVRALRAIQGDGVPVYSFFLRGADIARIADISRVHRDETDALKGFQRREIRDHVNGIVEFLNSGPVVFPNAIILALSSEIEFRQSRGPSPEGLVESAQSGTLVIPVFPEGQRVAWIVDGQQRSLALSRAKNPNIPVPVVGFVSSDIGTQREQFMLVNRAKPLPNRLINELLPEIGSVLPRDLAPRKLPSELCNLLNRDPSSPFFRLIRRESDEGAEAGVVIDTAMIEAIRRNLRPPLGSLSQFAAQNKTDADAMYRLLVTYWSAVRDTFPGAWGIRPQESRLMHSAGIRAVGALMDSIVLRAEGTGAVDDEIRRSLGRIAPHCRWTEGTWEQLGWRWNEVQSTSQHVSRLSDFLVQLDREFARAGKK
ncbi:DGQHR domain-containing protein DpdB [Prosthecomicrobium sp. N25]|uniref:DGQHR domain-containing protein DpdB n=1 Tax=Prosthecomicrobium sp. N25 TaxID=3129254 RepID=UPI0030787B70